MNERLAIEAEIACLPAFGGKAVRVADVVVNAVENIEPIGARRRKAVHQPRQHRRAAGNEAGAGILGEIVGAHHEASEPGL